MKRKNSFKGTMVIAALAFMFAMSSRTYSAGFVSGSTGADGSFAPITNTELQLPPDGVFNFTTVDVPAGVTVTFKRNTANTPVYILATGDVSIAGTISVNGENGKDASTGTGNIGEGTIPVYGGKGGPGGFDGGRGGLYVTIGFPEALPSDGLGPGGGKIGTSASSGGGGGYSNNGVSGLFSQGNYWSGGGGLWTFTSDTVINNSYGNVLLLPLLGGSGGGGGRGSNGGSGGGGGGALLIASSGTINISGNISANGGNGGTGSYGCGGGGSGGAIRLIANIIKGNGNILVNGGSGSSVSWSSGYFVYKEDSGAGSPGRIRLEAYTFNRTAATSPAASTGSPSSVFVANLPTLSITSIGGSAVPVSATGSYDTPDITFPNTTTNPVTMNISATNIPVGTTVTVMVIPVSGNSSTYTSAPLSGVDAISTTTASITLPSGTTTIIQASAIFTVQTAMYWNGEKIEKVRVAATIGKGSETVYITESGKEIKAEKLMAMLVE